MAKHAMVARGDGLLVAVSGGVDSVVLLELLYRLADELSMTLTVAHLDHGLRSTSGEDAAFVERLAHARGLPFVGRRIEVLHLARSRGGNLEATARDCRRAFLAHTAARIGAQRIALGHSLDDRAETVLFNLARGAGLTGLGALPPVRDRIVRPLIAVSRAEIQAFAKDEGLSWCEDETNADLALSRNRIRHCVLPELERINSKVLDALARASDLAAEEAALAATLLSSVWDSVCLAAEDGQVVLSIPALRGAGEVVQRALLRRALAEVRGDLTGIERVHVDNAHGLLSPYRGARVVHLPGATVHLQRDRIVVSSREDPVVSGSAPAPSHPVHLGVNDLHELGVRLVLALDDAVSEGGTASGTPFVERADADRVAFPLHVRGRLPGDRFRPLGMTAQKKLNAFMIDAEIPAARRDRWPLLCDQRGIIWVTGVRLADTVKLTRGTRRVLRMETGALR